MIGGIAMFESSRNMDTVKSIGIGLAVGTAAAYAGSKMMTRSGRRACKKGAVKCMKSMESVLDTIAAMTK